MNIILNSQKIPIAMRITLLLLFVLAFQLQAEQSYSQTTKISLEMKNRWSAPVRMATTLWGLGPTVR